MEITYQVLGVLGVVVGIIAAVVRNLGHRDAGIWTGCVGACLAVIAFFAWLQDFTWKRDAQREITQEWQPPELPDGCEKVYLIAGARITILVEKLKTGPHVPFDINGTTPITVSLRNHRLYVDTEIVGPKNTKTVIRNGKIGPTWLGWDRNSSSNAFEIVDETRTPVLQVIYEQPERVVVNGVFAGGNIFWQGQTRKALFKYPAYRYPSQYAE
jgi:hypothetical protein